MSDLQHAAATDPAASTVFRRLQQQARWDAEAENRRITTEE